jgi:hypothetical protein
VIQEDTVVVFLPALREPRRRRTGFSGPDDLVGTNRRPEGMDGWL